MSTRGLFLPLSVIKGDILDVAFDISIDGEMVDPSTITLEGKFTSDKDDAFPESFSFEISPENSNLVTAKLSGETTSTLTESEYNYQIRFLDSDGNGTTILYGSLSALPSPILS